jgi:hypothetical protein
MLNIDWEIGRPIKIPFTSVNLQTGLITFADAKVLIDGVLTVLSPAQTYTEIGGGLYTMNFTPQATGVFSIFLASELKAVINCVQKGIYSYLRDIEDSELGSWTWDKALGVLTLLRQDGTTLHTYNYSDSVSIASREKVS